MSLPERPIAQVLAATNHGRLIVNRLGPQPEACFDPPQSPCYDLQRRMGHEQPHVEQSAARGWIRA